MYNVHVYKWENAYIRDLNAWEILKNFYLFIKVKGGVHYFMYMYRNTESALTTESLDGYLTNLVGIKYSWHPHICIDVWAKSAKGRIQGRAIIGKWGGFLQRTSSLELFGRLQQQTEYIAMIYKYFGRSVDIFGSILTLGFWHVYLDLVIVTFFLLNIFMGQSV